MPLSYRVVIFFTIFISGGYVKLNKLILLNTKPIIHKISKLNNSPIQTLDRFVLILASKSAVATVSANGRLSELKSGKKTHLVCTEKTITTANVYQVV